MKILIREILVIRVIRGTLISDYEYIPAEDPEIL